MKAKLFVLFTVTSVYMQTHLLSSDHFGFIGQTALGQRVSGEVSFPIQLGDTLEIVQCSNGAMTGEYIGLPGFAKDMLCSGIFLYLPKK